MKNQSENSIPITCDECGEPVALDAIIFATKYRQPVTICHACAQELYTLCPVCNGNVYDKDYDKRHHMCKMCFLYE